MPTAVFDLDKVLLGGDTSTLFLHGLLRRAPGRALPLLLASPVLLAGAALPQTRALGARLMTRLAVGRPRSVEDIAAAYREVLSVKPEAAVAEAMACVRAHERAGDTVVVATGCEETLARGFLAAIGLGHLEVVGSQATVPARRAMGGSKVTMLIDRGYPPPWAAVYTDSASDLPLFAGTPRPVLVNADEPGGPAGRAHPGPASRDGHLALSRGPAVRGGQPRRRTCSRAVTRLHVRRLGLALGAAAGHRSGGR